MPDVSGVINAHTFTPASVHNWTASFTPGRQGSYIKYGFTLITNHAHLGPECIQMRNLAYAMPVKSPRNH